MRQSRPAGEFEAALTLQRALSYEVSGDRHGAALIVCEHPPLITVGRQGSWTHLHLEPEELQARLGCRSAPADEGSLWGTGW